MNERIKQMARQSGATDQNGSMATTVFCFTEMELDRFAELIVRECARVAIEKQTENDINNIVSKNPAKDFAYALIKHFGVEE